MIAPARADALGDAQRAVAEAATNVEYTRAQPFYSATLTPEPPISFGRSCIFGSPSFIRSVVS